MASVYPGALDSLATTTTNSTVNLNTHAALHNDANDAINKIEAELGINPSGSVATVAARLDAMSAMPAGVIAPFAGSTAPSGWVLADGTAYNGTNATYTALWGVIGTTYGGTGQSSFNVPDLRGRLPVGKGTHADVDALGDNDGSSLADRRPKHKHTVNDPGHTHGGTFSAVEWAANGATNAPINPANTSSATTGITVGPQSSSPTDGPAYITLNYIIKL